MAASTQPFDGSRPEQETWQSLVGDQRYRLFAAGHRRAAIAECLPAYSRLISLESLPPVPTSFDARYGLRLETQKRMVLLTEVSRVAGEPARGAAGAQWRWEATHRVQPISQLKAYIDEQTGSCVFFLTRSTQPIGGAAGKTRERLVDSAVRIGKSLGLDAKNLEALRVAGVVHEMGKMSPGKAAGQKFYVSADSDHEDAAPCGIADCGHPAMARLGDEPYCTEHFIATCYEQLDRCAERLSRRPVSQQESETMWNFLHACIEQAGLLTRDPFHQESLERARLLDIQYTARELGRHMRRSPRLLEAIPVRLLCETPGRPWEENLRTKLISQHGAMLECEHIVRPEDWLFVERVDTGSRARARLAWRGSVVGGRLPVALEFVDVENFWDVTWTGRSSASTAKGASA